MAKNYYSNAEWPRSLGIKPTGGNIVTQDSHQTEEDATRICKVLERLGLGANGHIYPIRTWVSETKGV